MSRSTTTNFPGAYRLVVTKTLAGEEHTEYIGPYQTLGAAKGQLTQELQHHYYEHYDTKTGHLEVATGWERVE